MEGFKKILPTEIGNAMKCIGKDWMLITIRDERQGRVNAMTASWGAMGVLWNKNICICFIRPQRHSFSLAESESEFSLAFFGEEYRAALGVCGRESGRDTDKIEKCGFHTAECGGVPVITEANMLITCKKLYADDIRECAFIDKEMLAHYEKKDYHRFYVCEIKEVYVKE